MLDLFLWVYAHCETGFEANDDILMATLIFVWLTQVNTMLIPLPVCWTLYQPSFVVVISKFVFAL